MSSDVAISVKDLNKIYGLGSKNEKVALNNISLQVKKGSIFGLLGPNGPSTPAQLNFFEFTYSTSLFCSLFISGEFIIRMIQEITLKNY